MKHREAAGFVLYRDSGNSMEFLLLKNRRFSEWGFPKGHLDKSDVDLLDCAHRELLEETGFDEVLVHSGFRYVMNYTVPATASEKGKPYEKSVTYFLARFEGKGKAANPKLSKEHFDAAWLEREEAHSRLQHNALEDLIDQAASYLAS